jgi:hypothetical protein
MSYPKQNPEVKKYAICGSVVIRTKEVLTGLAVRGKETVGAYVGRILDDWVKDSVEKGLVPDTLSVRSYVNYSRDQTEVIKKEATMYREGKLGKRKEAEILKHARGRK